MVISFPNMYLDVGILDVREYFLIELLGSFSSVLNGLSEGLLKAREPLEEGYFVVLK